MIKRPSPSEGFRAVFEPYATEMGLLVYAWNHLQDELARLFSLMFGITNQAMALAVWHSTPSDLSQRKMLRAAVKVKLADAPELKDVLWLLDKVDYMLSGKRNDAIHAPVIMRTGFEGASIVPYEIAMNPRAANLKGKDIISELVWYRDTAMALRKYCTGMFRAIADSGVGDWPWPDRPVLPHLRRPTTKGSSPAESGPKP